MLASGLRPASVGDTRHRSNMSIIMLIMIIMNNDDNIDFNKDKIKGNDTNDRTVSS